MTGWASAAAGVLLAGLTAPAVLFAFEDPAITESSGLVDAGATVYTVNDSGDGPVLYAVDAGSGATTGTTTYSRDPVVDVEGLAPAPGGEVWVGDIGDNLRRRAAVEVYRVRPGAGTVARHELVYPDGPRDAETLLAHPRTGRLFVVSKTVFGGTVYAAPRRLRSDRPNRLVAVAQVPGFLTDGAFWPDGRHVLVRGYADAWLLRHPGFGVVARFDLPEQDQGEGLSVGARGRVLVSSEGEDAEVLQVLLPPRVRTALAQREPQPAPAAQPRPTPAPETARDARAAPAAAVRTALLGAAGVLAALGIGAAALAWRSRRRA